MLDAGAGLEALPSPRRLAVGALLASALGLERELGALYTAVASRAAFPLLEAAFREFGQIQTEHVAALERLVRALGGDPEAATTSAPPLEGVSGRAERTAALAQAFSRQRALEATYREALGLLPDPALCPSLRRLAAAAAHHRARLHDLYLRYS
jgi:hypothetical protein